MRKRKEEERAREMAHKDLGNDTCVVYGRGFPEVGALGVKSTFPFLLCLCWAKKGARQVPSTSPDMGTSPVAPCPSSLIPVCGNTRTPDPCHSLSLLVIILVPPQSGESQVSWLRVGLPSGLCRPGRCPGRGREDGGLCTSSPEFSHPSSLSEETGWWAAVGLLWPTQLYSFVLWGFLLHYNTGGFENKVDDDVCGLSRAAEAPPTQSSLLTVAPPFLLQGNR